MDSPVPSFSVLKLLANGFPDSVQYYLGIWSPYHSAFSKSASAIIFPAALVWIMFLLAKFSSEKGRAFVGGIFMVGVLGILLSPSDRGAEMFGGATGAPGASIQVANGSYWSYKIPGAIYGLFKSALASVDNNRSEAQNLSMRMAYDFQTEAASKRLEAGPLRDIYLAYTTSCNKATQSTAITSNVNSVATLQNVGLHGGAGIGYSDADFNAFDAIIDDYKKSKDTLFSGASWDRLMTSPSSAAKDGVKAVFWTPYANAKGASRVSDAIAAGKQALSAIPADENPFKNVATDFVDGFKIPTKSYWLKLSGKSGVDGESDYVDARQFKNGAYKSPDIADSDVPTTTEITSAAYPENCLEAFELADHAMREYRSAQEEIRRANGTSAVDKNFAEIQATHDLSQLNDKLRQEAESLDANGKYKEGYTAGTYNKPTGDTMAGGILDSIVDTSADIGAWKDSIFLKYKVPFVISGCAMLVAALITAFPIFAVMSLFLGPGLLITYIKLVCFGFLVVFFNDLFLSMGSELIGMTNLLAIGDAAGTTARGSNAIDVAAVTAEVLVYSSITVIEVLLAKILIWDDVSAVSSFSPGGSFGTAMAAGGGLLAGAIAVGAAFIPGGGAVAAVAKTGLSAAGSATSMATGGRGPGGGGGGLKRPSPSKPQQQKQPPSSGGSNGASPPAAVSSAPTIARTSASATNMTPPPKNS